MNQKWPSDYFLLHWGLLKSCSKSRCYFHLNYLILIDFIQTEPEVTIRFFLLNWGLFWKKLFHYNQVYNSLWYLCVDKRAVTLWKITFAQWIFRIWFFVFNSKAESSLFMDEWIIVTTDGQRFADFVHRENSHFEFSCSIFSLFWTQIICIGKHTNSLKYKPRIRWLSNWKITSLIGMNAALAD